MQHHRQVNLSYASPNDDRYVSISGEAKLVNDRKKIELLWHESLREWFPGGPGDANVVLLQVDVSEAEYWDAKVNQLKRVVKGFLFGTPDKRKHEKIVWSQDAEIAADSP